MRLMTIVTCRFREWTLAATAFVLNLEFMRAGYMFKILALNGGGIRAVFQSRLIQRIEEAMGYRI
ncbi:MAG: hypothetical protein EOP04_07025 [Proteobacteria bacterium]|nr:MAG: hypothetical protein EOP04_07025 [Pseudomonadota bacterium]